MRLHLLEFIPKYNKLIVIMCNAEKEFLFKRYEILTLRVKFKDDL